MADLYNDGTLVHGSATLTFTPVVAPTTPFDGIADPDWSLTRGSKRVEQTNANGEPIKAFGLATTAEGSCTIQVGATAVRLGDTFVSDKTGAQVYFVTEVGTTYGKEDYLKQSIKFVAKLT